jgi:hypothetical protein
MGKEKEEKENADVVDRSSIKLKITQQSSDKNTANINIKQITNGEEELHDHYQTMSSDDDDDDDDDNDSELLETLAQLHGLVHQPQLSTEIYKNKTQQCKQDEIRNLNLDEKHNLISSNDDRRNEEKKSSTFFSLTSLTSSALFNDDESHSTDIMLDSNGSSSLTMSHSFDNEVRSIVDKLVSDILQLALNELNESSQPIEHFVEQILSEAIYQVHTEDQHSSTENLVSIIDWHHQIDKQILDPFDQQFHSHWISHFQNPDDNINPSSFHSNAFDEFNLFSMESNQADFIQKEIVSSPFLTNPHITNNNSIFQDNFTSDKVIQFY